MSCPNCGYCQHCGRGRSFQPYYPVPYYPAPTWPTYPSWPTTTGGDAIPLTFDRITFTDVKWTGGTG